MIFKYKTVQNEPYNKTQLIIDGTNFGDVLDDNSYTEDGFRFHDLYHIGLYYFFNHKNGVFASLKNEVKPNKKINSVEESVVMFMFQYPKYNHMETIQNTIFVTLTELMLTELQIPYNKNKILFFIEYVSDFIKELEIEPNTEFTFCQKKFFKKLDN